MYDFFISYSRFDAEYARALWEYLQILGIPVWFAESEVLIKGRENIRDEEILKTIIVEACEKSKYCLLLLSKHSVESYWVMDVEARTFIQREQRENKKLIIPIIIGKKNDQTNSWLPKEYLEKELFELEKLDNVKVLVTKIMKQMGREKMLHLSLPQTKSSHTNEQLFTIINDINWFQIALDIGSEWSPAGPKLEGVLFFIRNTDNNFLLNMVVIPSKAKTDETAHHVEEQNYFAETFLYGTTKEIEQLIHTANKLPIKSFLSEAMFPIKKVLGRLIVGYKEILGSHLYNILNKPCFAFTYIIRYLFTSGISRKYIIVIKPPNSNSYYEFIFTTTYYGSYRVFLSQIGRVDTIVHSFRFTNWDYYNEPPTNAYTLGE